MELDTVPLHSQSIYVVEQEQREQMIQRLLTDIQTQVGTYRRRHPDSGSMTAIITDKWWPYSTYPLRDLQGDLTARLQKVYPNFTTTVGARSSRLNWWGNLCCRCWPCIPAAETLYIRFWF